MLLSILQSLIVPRILGVTEYGYWQLFIFYTSYVGFFHLGLNDGVYLLKGGQPREQIDQSCVKSQLIVGITFQLLIALAIVVAALTGRFGEDRSFVIACSGVFLVIQNAASYLMFVLQAMNETRKSSYSTMVNRLSFLLPLIILLLTRTKSFKPFVIAYIVSSALQLAYCSWHCRDILMADLWAPSASVKESLGSIRVGIKLMLANIASQLILGVLRLTIDAAWGIETFGKLSLALSLVNFFLAFVSQAAMVLFPALRQSGDGEVRSFYCTARDALGIAFPSMYLLYFPMVWLLGMWLPAYADSFRYFAWLIPICVFDGKMNITCTTLFKVRREEARLLRINVVTTAACASMVLFAVFELGSVELALASSTAVIIGRSVYSERVVSLELGAGNNFISLWELFLTVSFVAFALLLPAWAAVFAFAALYLVFLYAHRDRVVSLGVALKG